MKTFNLKATLREELGKKSSKKFREKGLVPAVIYGADTEEPINILVEREGIRNLIYTPDIFLVQMEIEGRGNLNVILKELQFHPVTDVVIHIDFLQVNAAKPIVMNVPVSLVGHAIGVKAGGKLNHRLRRLAVKALYSDIPEQLEINVSKLALGKSIQVKDLKFGNLNLVNAPDAVVCSVNATRVSVSDVVEDEEGEEGAEGEEASAEESNE